MTRVDLTQFLVPVTSEFCHWNTRVILVETHMGLLQDFDMCFAGLPLVNQCNTLWIRVQYSWCTLANELGYCAGMIPEEYPCVFGKYRPHQPEHYRPTSAPAAIPLEQQEQDLQPGRYPYQAIPNSLLLQAPVQLPVVLLLKPLAAHFLTSSLPPPALCLLILNFIRCRTWATRNSTRACTRYSA